MIMKRNIILTATISLILGIQSCSLCINNSVINANNVIQVMSHTSQYTRIEGKIFDSQITDNSKVIFLNFGKNFNTSLSALIYNTDMPAFIDAGIGEPDKYFKNKKVVIEGVVRISNGKPEIIITSPDQIKLVND